VAVVAAAVISFVINTRVCAKWLW